MKTKHSIKNRGKEHLDTTTGTPDLSGSGPSHCRINPAFRLTSLSLRVVVSRRAPQEGNL